MAWNGSDGAAKPQKIERKAKPSAWRGLLAAIIVIGGAVGICLYFFDPATVGGQCAKDKAKTSKIAEVTPDLVSEVQTQEDEPKSHKRQKQFWEVDASMTNGFNDAMIRKWKALRRPKPAFTNDMAVNIPRLACEIFDNRVENEIAVLITMAPGTSMIGMPKYGDDYEQAFLKSCETPIIISEDDDEFTKQLKNDVIQVKIDLLDRIRDGEKIGDIMRDARLEAQRLSQIKNDIISLLRENIADENMDDNDVELCYAAANKLLEQHGIAPVKPLSINKYWLKHRINESY